MGAHEHVRRSRRHEIEEDPEVVNIDSVRNYDDWVVDGKRMSHSRKSGSGEDDDGLNYNSRKRKHENRKRSGGSSSSRADSDQDDYESRKQATKKSEENTLDVLSTWYQDGETENKPGNRGHSRGEESERKKSSSKYSEKNGTDVDDNKGSLTNEDKERSEDQRKSTQEIVHGHAMSSNADEGRDKSRRDAENPMSRTPEKIGRWDDRSKGRDDSWADRDNVKDSRRRKQDMETRESETNYDRDWKSQRRGCDRIDGHSIGRKDGSRTEAVKTKYGISSENYDVIEIQTKPFDYAKENSRTRNGEVFQQPDTKPPDSEERSRNTQGSGQSGEEIKDDQHSWRDDNNDFQVERPRGQKSTGGQSFSGGPLPPLGNNRMGRVGRGRQPGRDSPMPLGGSTFGPLGLPSPGPLQSLPPNMTPTLGPISPGVFIPPFQPPIVWSGARGVEMNMLGVPSGFPPGPLGPRFSPNLGNAPSGSLVFNPSGIGRGIPPSMSGANFNIMGRGQLQEKGWIPPRSNVPLGKAPSRGEQNDYSQNFVDTGMRPQNFIREWELTSVVEDYPRLRELIQKKDEIVANSSFPPMYYKCDLKEQALSPEFFGTKFDVILVDPPWEEYVHRAPGVTDQMSYWTFEEIMNLKIEAIADTPSFIFLWVGDGVGLEQGRQCLKKWGFRRCEDICWVKTNKSNATPGLRHDSHTLFQRSKEHCLMGIKGTVRRSTDGHIIHANIDTDVIIAEEPPYGSTAKPEDMHRIVEHFALGRRRLELFGEDHNIRSGWLTVGNGLSSSNFDSEAYIKNFADKDGKMWVGGGGRNPPPEAPHLVLTTPDIESLRPKSPMKNQQQMQMQMQQQQSTTISLITPTSSSNKRPGNLAQNHNGSNLSIEAPASSMPSPAPWGEAFLPPGYGYNAPFGPGSGESQRGMSM